MTIVPELQVISFHCDTMYVQSVNVTHCSPQNRCCPKAIIQRISNYKVNVCFNAMIQYTWVNKRMRLFAKVQGNMRLIPNLRLIAKGKIDHTSKIAMPSLVARILDSK